MNKRFSENDSRLIFALAVAVAVIGSLVASWALSQSDSSLTYWCVNGLYSLALGLVVVVYCAAKKSDFVKLTKLNVKPRAVDIAFGCLLALIIVNFMTPINDAFCTFLESFGLPTPSVNIPEDSGWFELILFVCIFPAINEELLFRGGVASGYVRKFPVGGIFLSGAIFALFHMNPAQTLPQFVLGCTLALVYKKSQSLVPCIAAHFFNNFSALVLSDTVEPSGFYTTYALPVALGGAALFAVVCFVYCKTIPAAKQIDGEDLTPSGRNVAVVAVFSLAVAFCLAQWIANLLV